MFEKTFKINYCETDIEGFLFLPQLFYYSQETSISDTDIKKHNLKYYIDNDFGWVYLTWNGKIHRYPKFNEEITFTTGIIKYNGVFGDRGFVARDKDQNIIFEGEVKVVLLNLKTKEIIKPSDEIIDDYGEKANASNFEYKRVPKIMNYEFVYEKEITVLRHNTDSNKHTNNISYLQYAEDFIPIELYKEYKVSDLSASFRKESFLDDKLIFKVYVNEDSKEVVVNIFKEEVLISDIFFKMKRKDSF
ncbi:MAG: acyl-[acyl-carrier-protein] thioesterase [Lachnospirales bacterium]